jgi:hypothetical protein
VTTKGLGRCHIDSVQAGEVGIDMFGSGGPTLTLKFAYVSEKAGARLGYGNRNQGWSPETMTRLLALIESAERDVCRDLFEGGVPADDGGATVVVDESDGIPSL